MANPRELTIAEQVAHGLIPAGPLAPAITSKNPEANAQAIREFVNPAITPINPIKMLGKAHKWAGEGLGHGVGALSFLNPANKMMTPEQRTLRSRTVGNQLRDVGESMLLPAAQGGQLFGAFVTRLAQQGGLAGLQQAMAGGDMGAVFGHAAIGAGLQGMMEAPAKIIRFFLSSAAGSRILTTAAAQHKEALGSFEARQKFDQEFVGELNQLRAQGAKAEANRASADYAKRAFAHEVEGQQMKANWEAAVTNRKTIMDAAEDIRQNKVASNLAKDWDARVPAWKGMAQTVEGLIDRVYGQGPAKLRASFDTSLKEVVAKAEGQMLKMPAAEAEALGLTGGALPATPSGRGGPNALIGDGSEMAMVNAADVAKAVLGKKSEIDPELYHSVATLLTQNGLGNAKANAEYSAGKALEEFVNVNKALEFIDKPTLHIDRLLKGLTDTSKLKKLHGRLPEEDALRGSMAGAREGRPPVPPEIPKPVQGPLAPRPEKPAPPLPIKTDPNLDPSKAPTMPTDEDMGLTESALSNLEPWKAHSIGAMVGSGVGGILGGSMGHYGPGGLTGGVLGSLVPLLLPKGPAILKGPISDVAETALAKTPSVAAGIIRAIAGEGEVSPEDLAEIQAAIASGQTATTNPNLQLGIDPSELR